MARTGDFCKEKKAKLLEAIEAEIKLPRKIPVEDYNSTRELGRFVLYQKNKFAGIGIIID